MALTFPLGGLKRWLGISVGETSIQVAQVSSEQSAGPQTHTAEFEFPAGVNLENPAALGAALAQFLKLHGFSARHAIFGVPARWIITHSHPMPPADEQTAGQVLWLHAAEQIAPRLGEMVFDYAGRVDEDASSTLLLMGLQKRWMDRIVALARAAQIKAVAITPETAALAQVCGVHADCSMVLSILPEAVELATLEAGRLRSLRHLGACGNGSLLAELRRAAAAQMAPSGMVVWDALGKSSELAHEIGGVLGMPVQLARAEWVEMNERGAAAMRLAAPAALALTLRAGRGGQADFLHPRLSPPRMAKTGNRAFWLTTAAAAVVLGAVAAYADLGSLARQDAETDRQLQILQPGLPEAKRFVTAMQFARGFQPRRPVVLACLRDITSALAVGSAAPGQTYLSDFSFRADSHGEITGRCHSEQEVLNIVDALNATGHFAQVNCRLDPRDSRGGHEIAFTVTFRFLSDA